MARDTEKRGEAAAATGKTEGSEIRRDTWEAGIARVLAPAQSAHEGARILIYGRTRSGKSTFSVRLSEEILSRGVADTLLVHDVKYPDHPQYEGAYQHGDLRPELVQAAGSSPVIVLRPPVTAAEAAKVCRWFVEHGERTCLVIDETRRALGGQQKWVDHDGEEGPGRGARNFEWLCLEAGGLGGSLVLLVQRPRQLPGDAIDSAQVHVVFGVGGRSLGYLVNAGTVPEEAADTVRRLQPGEFCIFSDDDDWNRTVYYSPLS